MAEITEGTLLTVPLHDSTCVLLHVLHVHPLPLDNQYHVAVLDTLMEAGPEGYDEQNEYMPRTHVLNGEENASQAVDHIAITEESLMASEPIAVGWREVTRADTLGYRAWLTLMHERAVERGLLKKREEGSNEDDYGNEEEPVEDEAVSVEKGGEVEEGSEEDGSDGEGTPVVVRPWHRATWQMPVGDILLSVVDEFRNDDTLRATAVGGYLVSRYSEDRSEEIEGLVVRLAEGDFSASEELALYGDAALAALERHLVLDADPQFVEDALSVMTTIGSDRAYSAVADAYSRYRDAAAPLSRAATRGYLYAVTLTGGTAEPLRAHLSTLETITDPELADDLGTARAAVAEASVSR